MWGDFSLMSHRVIRSLFFSMECIQVVWKQGCPHPTYQHLLFPIRKNRETRTLEKPQAMQGTIN